jgi:hypothetical protein
MFWQTLEDPQIVPILMLTWIFYYIYSFMYGLNYLFTNEGVFKLFTKIGAFPLIILELMFVLFSLYEGNYNQIVIGIMMYVVPDLISNIVLLTLFRTEDAPSKIGDSQIATPVLLQILFSILVVVATIGKYFVLMSLDVSFTDYISYIQGAFT